MYIRGATCVEEKRYVEVQLNDFPPVERTIKHVNLKFQLYFRGVHVQMTLFSM